MYRTRHLKVCVATAAVPLLYLVGVAPDAPTGLALIQEGHAVVGAPLSPVSAAGVARRTTRRVAVIETTAAAAAAPPPQAAPAAAPRPPGAPPVGTVVTTLPAGCKLETKNGVEYQNCGGVLYRAAFQGSNLVYVVQ